MGRPNGTLEKMGLLPSLPWWAAYQSPYQSPCQSPHGTLASSAGVITVHLLAINLTLLAFAYKPPDFAGAPLSCVISLTRVAAPTAREEATHLPSILSGEFAAKLAPATAIHRVSSLHSATQLAHP